MNNADFVAVNTFYLVDEEIVERKIITYLL